jgi:hypothetical protein
MTAVAEKGVVAAMRLMARELPTRINAWTRETGWLKPSGTSKSYKPFGSTTGQSSQIHQRLADIGDNKHYVADVRTTLKPNS